MADDETIVGIHPVEEALRSGRAIRTIHVARSIDPSKSRPIIAEAGERGIPIRQAGRDELDRLAAGRLHQGIVAVASVLRYATLDSVLARATSSPPALIVALDQVQDPRNFGAIVRTAETAGAHGLVVTGRRTAPLTGAVARASAGAVEHLPIARVSNLVNAINLLKRQGIWVLGVDVDGETSWARFDYTVPLALVFGGEHRGIRRLVSEHCDARIHLPVHGRVASLNVSVAAGVVLYEAVRQRLQAVENGGRNTD